MVFVCVFVKTVLCFVKFLLCLNTVWWHVLILELIFVAPAVTARHGMESLVLLQISPTLTFIYQRPQRAANAAEGQVLSQLIFPSRF